MATISYVIAGTVKKAGKNQRVGGIVDIEDTGDAFKNDMAALAFLPIECHKHRHGRNIPECWPLESAEGTRLAVAAGLVKPQKALV